MELPAASRQNRAAGAGCQGPERITTVLGAKVTSSLGKSRSAGRPQPQGLAFPPPHPHPQQLPKVNSQERWACRFHQAQSRDRCAPKGALCCKANAGSVAVPFGAIGFHFCGAPGNGVLNAGSRSSQCGRTRAVSPWKSGEPSAQVHTDSNWK